MQHVNCAKLHTTAHSIMLYQLYTAVHTSCCTNCTQLCATSCCTNCTQRNAVPTVHNVMSPPANRAQVRRHGRRRRHSRRSIALSLCTTAHPLRTTFSNIIGTSFSQSSTPRPQTASRTPRPRMARPPRVRRTPLVPSYSPHTFY